MHPNYDPEAVKPMEEELERAGIRPLHSAQEVVEVMTEAEGTTLVVVNSVCGCAAGGARPGVMQALQHHTIPDRMVTVFAGMDHEAVQKAREYMRDIPPSSPCIALFKEGSPAFVLERRHIEQMNADRIADSLAKAFDQYCTAKGPAISAEEFAKINPVQQCGSSIPLYQ